MPPLSLLIKLASSLGNLSCPYYFYYQSPSGSRTGPSCGLTQEAALAKIVSQRLAQQMQRVRQGVMP